MAVVSRVAVGVGQTIEVGDLLAGPRLSARRPARSTDRRGTRPRSRPLARDPPRQGAEGRARAQGALRDDRSGLVVRDLYTAADTAGLDEDRDLGRPGEYPFTRGVQPTMYRSRFWTMRQYAGFATAEETNRGSATCSTTARRGSRWRSTCRPRWATTPTPPRRKARLAGSASRSRASPTWTSSSTGCRSARCPRR